MVSDAINETLTDTTGETLAGALGKGYDYGCNRYEAATGTALDAMTCATGAGRQRIEQVRQPVTPRDTTNTSSQCAVQPT